ncbi:MAG: glycosyltransferase [Patescibacteria group bacterium]|nr:glycosyltransferase [Patescibacteria group bacterium]
MENKKLRVLFITPAYWPAIDYGGPVQAVKLLAENLKSFDYDIKVFTLAYGLKENKFQRENINKVDVFYFGFYKFFRWFIPRGLIKRLIKEKFDICHINLVWDPISWISGVVLSLLNKKFVISPRGTVEEKLIRGKNFLIKKIIYFLLIKFIFKKASGFHFTSRREMEEFFSFVKIRRPYTIILNPFDYREFEKKKDINLIHKFNLENKDYLLYFGRINWKKRIELLIDAFYDLNKKYSNLYLAIIGSADTDYFIKIKQKIKNLNLEDKIIISEETISGDLKIAVYQNAYCLIVPSISENFGYVVVEALAANIPVIISEGVGLKDLIEKYNAGLVFNGSDYDDLKNNLVNKLDLILTDNSLREKLIQNGKELLYGEFNNKVLTQKMVEFYAKFL